MTDAEREAEEALEAGTKCDCIKGDDPCYDHCLEAVVKAIQRAEQRGYRGGWADATNRHEVMDDRHFYRKGILRGAEIAKKIDFDSPSDHEAGGFYHAQEVIAEAIRKEADSDGHL